MNRGALALALALLAGCGYSLVRERRLPGGASSLKVLTVRNQTAQAEAGGWFAAALRDELSARGQLATEGATAPELSAELVVLRSAPSALGAGGTSAFRLDAELHAHLRGANGLALDESVNAGEDYLVGIDTPGTEANRRAAARRLAASVARELVERLSAAGMR